MISEYASLFFREICPSAAAKQYAAHRKEERAVHTLVATFGVE
jgi:hypothetical protein